MRFPGILRDGTSCLLRMRIEISKNLILRGEPGERLEGCSKKIKTKKSKQKP
jgi:hypothetical protein